MRQFMEQLLAAPYGKSAVLPPALQDLLQESIGLFSVYHRLQTIFLLEILELLGIKIERVVCAPDSLTLCWGEESLLLEGSRYYHLFLSRQEVLQAADLNHLCRDETVQEELYSLFRYQQSLSIYLRLTQ